MPELNVPKFIVQVRGLNYRWTWYIAFVRLHHRGPVLATIVGFALNLTLINFTPRFWPTATVFVLLGDKDLY